MAFPAYLGHLADRAVLFSVLLELTYACNLDCVFCYNDRQAPGRPLDRARYLELLDELAELGVLHLALSGGEPLAHPDFFAIGARARELGFAVRVKSNGHALNRAAATRLVQEIDPFRVDISLHGASAATHDRQTRVAGSFDRLLGNLATLRELGARLRLRSVLTRWNEDEVEAMFALADRLGIGLDVTTNLSQRDDGDRSPFALAASDAGVRRLFETLLRRAGSRPPDCGEDGEPDRDAGPAASRRVCTAGSTSVTVDPYGAVLPCVQWRRPVGNLHDEPIGEIWRRSPALAEVRTLTQLAVGPATSVRGDGVMVAFCPAAAEALTGSPLAVHPGLMREAALWDAAKAAVLGVGASAGKSAVDHRPQPAVAGE